MKKLLLISTLVMVLTGAVQPAEAAAIPLRLSLYSSDGPAPPLPELLDAELRFSVEDSILTLEVENLTPEFAEDPALKINEIYFNTTENIEDLSLLDVVVNEGSIFENDSWSLTHLPDGFHVNGFGLYDVALIDGVGGDLDVIDPGEIMTFTIEIMGIEPFSAPDFTTQLSTQIDGHTIGLAAAKFFDGNGTSGYGSTDVPEPATLFLLGLGGLVVLRRKHKA